MDPVRLDANETDQQDNVFYADVKTGPWQNTPTAGARSRPESGQAEAESRRGSLRERVEAACAENPDQPHFSARPTTAATKDLTAGSKRPIDELLAEMVNSDSWRNWIETSAGREPLLIWLGLLDKDRAAMTVGGGGDPEAIAKLDVEIARIEARLSLQ